MSQSQWTQVDDYIADLFSPADPALAGHHRVDAVRGHLLEMAGDQHAARAHYQLAARRTLSLPEQRYLESRAAQLPPPDRAPGPGRRVDTAG